MSDYPRPKKAKGGINVTSSQVHLTLDYDNMYSETDFRPEIQYVIY